MKWAEVDWVQCTGCHPCPPQRVCSMHAIVKIASDEPVFIEMDRCHGCGKCVSACQPGALRLVGVDYPAGTLQEADFGK